MVNKKVSCGRLCKEYASLPLFSIDDCPQSVPAAGNRNGTSLNNTGSNGNYWSSTPNESNTDNAYNLNFNSGDHNTNWNNRNNGHSVRPVSELTTVVSGVGYRRFAISRKQLLVDLYRAYKDARKHKRGRTYQLSFEYELEDNLAKLCDELITASYKPLPLTCFIIHEPKMREVFAADFRDRIVHHLFYNYVHVLFENTFVHDSYSCIKGRGTHFGINRIKSHIRSVSAGYSKPCYVLKMDIKGYFMNIDRKRLLSICRETLMKMKGHRSHFPGKRWNDVMDFDFVEYLLETIINVDPVEKCIMKGNPSEWEKLPVGKSLFGTESECGLPIGNLSSQLFSNIYLNSLDQFVKRKLACKHYGRYVDDAYIVSHDRDYLKSLIPELNAFLENELALSLNPDKVTVLDAYKGVEFLGAYIKPFRTYISTNSLIRIKRNIVACDRMDTMRMQAVVNSCMGVMSHYDSFLLRRVMCGCNKKLNMLGKFDPFWLKYRPYKDMGCVFRV